MCVMIVTIIVGPIPRRNGLPIHVGGLRSGAESRCALINSTTQVSEQQGMHISLG